MTVKELYSIFTESTTLRVISCYSGKVMCKEFRPDWSKHEKIGEKEVHLAWADVEKRPIGYGSVCRPIICCYAEDKEGYYKDHPVQTF